MGKRRAGDKNADLANADEEKAASDAPAADNLINFRRLYITANIEIRITNLIYCIFIDTSSAILLNIKAVRAVITNTIAIILPSNFASAALMPYLLSAAHVRVSG